MRVLIVHNRYRLAGGEERHVDLLEQGLTAAGVETRRFERDSSSIGSSLPRRVATAAGMTYRPSAARSIQAVLETWKPDVVHAHNLFPLLTPAVLRAAKRTGAAVVLTAHNYRFACPSGTLLRRGTPHEDCVEGSSLLCGLRGGRSSLAEGLAYGVAIELQRRLRLLERWVDAFVAPSSFMKGMLVRAGFANDRIHAIAYGTPVGAASDTAEFALHAGRLAPEKGTRTLLEAAHLARDVPLVIAGDGPLADDVRRSNGSVRYVGRLAPDALAAMRQRAAFGVVPSECNEVLAFAALESIASGRPVVATRVGGLPEIVEDGVTGVLVDPASPEQLAEAMRALWHDPKRTAALGRAAHARAVERFSLEGQTSRLIELYERVA